MTSFGVRRRYAVRAGGSLVRLGRVDVPTVPPPDTTGADWSDTNPPWAWTSAAQLTAGWPTTGVTYVDLQTASSDFFTNLNNTINAASGRVVVRLQPNVYHLNQFRLIGSSGDPTYAFGFWFPKLQGFLNVGPPGSFATIQMDANSMSTAQLTKLATMTVASFSPNQMGLCRIDGSAASPVLLGGVTFQSADQQMLTSKASDLPVYIPQPAPHQGVVIYYDTTAFVSYCRFRGAGRAMNSQPPFEMANMSTARGIIKYNNCEFDGRRAASIDPAQPRRCGPWMGNNEGISQFTDTWFHHSNVSRYAANDQNSNTSGQYSLVRCKLEQITNTQNRDPALNGGATLGGYTNATPLGWESCNGTITLTDCIVSQDNPFTDAQVAQHLQLTSVGSRDPQGGRLTVNGGQYRNTAWPQLNGYIGFRIAAATYWKRDGYNNTLFVYHKDGQRLTPYIFTGTWPPSAATLTSLGLSPSTHFLIREA